MDPLESPDTLRFSPVLNFADLPTELRLLMEECYERYVATAQELDSRWQLVRRQIANGEAPGVSQLAALVAKLERYEARLAILETLYYDQKFGAKKAREPLR